MLGSVPAERGMTHTYTGKRASCLHVPLPSVLPPERLRGCKHSQNTSGQVPSARAATGTAEFPGILLWKTIGYQNTSVWELHRHCCCLHGADRKIGVLLQGGGNAVVEIPPHPEMSQHQGSGEPSFRGSRGDSRNTGHPQLLLLLQKHQRERQEDPDSP